MAKEDYKTWDKTQPKDDISNDLVCCSIILATLIKTGSTKSAAPREAVLLLKELKKQYSQENLGSTD